MAELNQQESEQLFRPTGALIAFSDTFTNPNDVVRHLSKDPEQATSTDSQHDFDSELTTQFRHLRPRDGEYGIGDKANNHLLAAYGVELVTNLTDGLQAEINKAIRRAQELGRPIHPNILEAQQFIKSRAIRVIANAAPRYDGNKDKIGSHFYLAMLDNGVEIYATPLDALQYVRDRVVSLFEIPNKDNPLFHGTREQFRSSIITRLCEEPEHLVRADQSTIPDQEHELQLAWADRYGNTRLRARNGSQVQTRIREVRNEQGQVGITFPGLNLDGTIAKLNNCLDAVSGGELGLYGNVADGEPAGEKASYIELVYKWERDNKINTHHRLGRPTIGSPIEIAAA
jgi:hypothetical protein